MDIEDKISVISTTGINYSLSSGKKKTSKSKNQTIIIIYTVTVTEYLSNSKTDTEKYTFMKATIFTGLTFSLLKT